MGRRGTGKTATIRKRVVQVYLPDEETHAEWTEAAGAAGTSLSKYMFEMASRGREGGLDIANREILARQLKEVSTEMERAQERIQTLEGVLARQEEELVDYRRRDFLQDNFEGIRSYEKNLINLLVREQSVRSELLLELLGLDPETQADAIRAVRNQLDTLEEYNLVETTATGWRWLG